MSEKPPASIRHLKLLLLGIGLIGVVFGPLILALVENPHVGWATILVGLIVMITSRFDEISEIGFGSFRASLVTRVEDVEAAMDAVRRLAVSNSRISLDLVQMSGRFGGISEANKRRMLEQTRTLLSDLGVSVDQVADSETGYHLGVEFDYAQWALKPSRGDQLPKDLQAERDKLRNGGLAGRPLPDEIEAFLERAGILTPERHEVLEDYRYYIANREHRRPEAWSR